MDLNFSITYLKQHKKPIIVASVIVVFILAIAFLAINLLNKSWFPLENESFLSETPSVDINRFKQAIERELTNLGYSDIKDATIREGSVTTTKKDVSFGTKNITSYTSNFLVDIDSIKQTYSASITWLSTNTNADDTIAISCPKISDSKYPDSECITNVNTSHDVDLWLPSELTLDTGEKVTIKNITIESNGKNLQIYLYSCNALDPPLETTEILVKDWVKNIVKDPLADKYQYNVRYGYCENAPIAPTSQN